MDYSISMNPNPLVQYLRKLPHEFTREDIVRYCRETGVRYLNFHYCG